MTELSQGGNAPVAAGAVTVTLAWSAPAGLDADASAYLLTEAGKVRGDADMIFYNQPNGSAVTFTPAPGKGGSFAVRLADLPADIHRIVFCVTIDEATARRQTVAMLSGTSIAVSPEGLSFAPALAGASEAAMVLGELYRRQGQWKFRAVGQGFNGGLGPLARSFGIDVADEPAAPSTPPSSPPPPPPPPSPPPPAAAVPPPRPVSLAKVSLDKPGQAISLEKRGSSFGEILVNLNWSRGAAKKGFFGGGGNAIDLDLGCLIELADGQKTVVQALGRLFGSFHQPPFIELSGDDRTGDVSQGETMRINGAQWNAIRRIAIFANIYDGAPNWQQTDGVVTVTMPDQPPIEVRMTEGRNDKRLCGVVLLENQGGQLKATRIIDYFRDQSELDRAFGWGLNWRAGRKD